MTKPKPIPTDPARDGQFQFVVSFRAGPMRTPMDHWLTGLRAHLFRWGEHYTIGMADLDVAVREIGAQGEASQFEGTGP